MLSLSSSTLLILFFNKRVSQAFLNVGHIQKWAAVHHTVTDIMDFETLTPTVIKLSEYSGGQTILFSSHCWSSNCCSVHTLFLGSSMSWTVADTFENVLGPFRLLGSSSSFYDTPQKINSCAVWHMCSRHTQ